MSWRSQVGSYFIITFLSVLIWLWAAGETREQESVISHATFVVQGDDSWIINPNVHAFRMTVEGSRLSLQNVQRLSREGFTIELTPSVGVQNLDLEDSLRRNAEFQGTGATLIEIDRPTATPAVDQIVTIQLPIAPNLPGVQTVETKPLVEPDTVTLSLPSLVQAQFSDIRVQAFIGLNQSAVLPEGVLQQIDVPLRILPETLATHSNIHLSPPSTRLSFTILSQVRELKLDRQINVQLAGPWQDQNDYLVEFDTSSLRDVTVIADAELIRQIESGRATVFAFVQLPSSEKERIANADGTATKPVSFFMAMIDDVGRKVEVRVNGSDQPPLIPLKVTAKQHAQPE